MEQVMPGADWVTAGATVVIAVAAIANVVVYLLLWNQTRRSVDEMRQTTEFLIVSEIALSKTPL